MPKVKIIKKIKSIAKPKPVKKVKSVEDKINAKVAKWDSLAGHPDHVKVSTSDFLDLLATTLEQGKGVSYASACGLLAVRPSKPKELLNTVRYLRRQAAKE
jgi:hypothetical protein